jgi:hypothetical protein
MRVGVLQLVAAALVRVVPMSCDPFPSGLVLVSNLVELIPQVVVQNGLAIRLYPTVGLPPGEKHGYPILEVLGIADQADAT